MKESGFGRRMADFYFELTGPEGEAQVFSSAEANEDEAEKEEE
jgi:hypothetical protein